MIAYLIVEHSDGPDWLLHEVHPTLEAATLRAEAWKTRDRSHGGRPYTWVRIIEQEGAEVFREWRFDDYRQEWVIDRGEVPEPDPSKWTFAQVLELNAIGQDLEHETPAELPPRPAELCGAPSPWSSWPPCLRALGHESRHGANGRVWGAE